jgi:c-di-GMP-binding flagellar brake protein YcgR
MTEARPQRRGFFRVVARLPVTCFASDPTAARPLAQIGKGHTENLSAGGLCILVDAALTPGDGLRIRLEAPPTLNVSQAGPLESAARVDRVDLLPDTVQRRVALRLLLTREAERDRWAQLVFELQSVKR